MSTETYMRAVVPIAALFAGTLWLGNAAYLYLSVSFIQMLKVCASVSLLNKPYYHLACIIAVLDTEPVFVVGYEVCLSFL